MSLSISIITPCLNRVHDVERCIRSVLRQAYPNVEHIVVDGGSTDGTLDVLARYPHLQVISEKDNGMYDALNKGLSIATGDIIGFINTDDLYAENVFLPVMEHFRDKTIDAVSGKAQIFKQDINGKVTTLLELSPPSADKIVETAIIGSTIFNAWFYRKSIVERAGGFDVRYKISGDADLILRLGLSGMKYLALESVHYLYRQHEDSLTFDLDASKLLKIFKDHSLFIKKHMASAELPEKAKALLNVLHTNTCLALAHQYEVEGRNLRSFLWKLRSSADVSSPIVRYFAL
jgi:glycosyltransferase involved in cell wall biosynthesis